MKKRVLLFLVTLSLVFPWRGLAQGAQPAGDLALGIRQVEEGDLDQAVITLDAVTQRLAKTKGAEKDLATAHLYLGMAHLGLSQWERAKAEMRDAWRNNPEMRLDPQKFPPRVLQTFEEARQEARAEDAARSAAAATPVPSPARGTEAPKKGGGGNKALLMVGGVALAGGGIALASGGSAAASPTPTTSGSTGTFQVTSASPSAGGRVNLQQQVGNGNGPPFLEIEFTLPSNASNAPSWSMSLQRSNTECLATQGVYAQRLDRGDSSYVAGATARFSVAFWVIRPGQGTVPTCGTTFTTDSLVFNFSDSGVALTKTLTIGWTFAQ